MSALIPPETVKQTCEILWGIPATVASWLAKEGKGVSDAVVTEVYYDEAGTALQRFEWLPAPCDGAGPDPTQGLVAQ